MPVDTGQSYCSTPSTDTVILCFSLSILMRTTETGISAVVAAVGAPSSHICALSFQLMPARSQSVLVRGWPAACAGSDPEGDSTASIDPAQTLALSSHTNLAPSHSDRVRGWYA